jgi:hypothetical protein
LPFIGNALELTINGKKRGRIRNVINVGEEAADQRKRSARRHRRQQNRQGLAQRRSTKWDRVAQQGCAAIGTSDERAPDRVDSTARAARNPAGPIQMLIFAASTKKRGKLPPESTPGAILTRSVRSCDCNLDDSAVTNCFHSSFTARRDDRC